MISATGNYITRHVSCVMCHVSRCSARRKTRNAFTFIELLIVVAIIGVLVAVSFPTFRNNYNNMQLNTFSRELQGFMNYLQERAIVERKIIYLNIDKENKEYWAGTGNIDAQVRLKTYHIPEEINFEIQMPQIAFFPDGSIKNGSIDKVEIKLTNRNNQSINLTSEGVFNGVKVKAKE